MKYYHRIIEDSIMGSADAGKIVLLLGARQTGKSTLLNHLIPEPHVKINLQEHKRRLEFSKSPELLSRILNARHEKRLNIFIDEIQKVPALMDETQYLYDQQPRRFRFFLTGSSSRQLVKKSGNLLPGRTHVFNLFPVIQPERGIPGILSPEKKPGKLFPKLSLEELLLYGSLPGILGEAETTKAKTLESYAELYLEEEIRRENLVKDIGYFANFLQLAALGSGKVVSFINLSRETGVSLNTIKGYYQVLVDTNTGYYLPAYSGSLRKRLLSTPKFIFFDAGVRNACAGTGFHKGLLMENGGAFLENWVAVELYHRIKLLGGGHGLSYYRTVSGAEIDLVLKTPAEIIPVEVKYTRNPAPEDARHIEDFMRLENNAVRGYVVCRCPEPRQITEHVTAIPWDML